MKIASISLITLLIQLAVLWALASGVTSGIKAAKNKCHTVYPIEKVLAGNWFCAVEKDQ